MNETMDFNIHGYVHDKAHDSYIIIIVKRINYTDRREVIKRILYIKWDVLFMLSN